MRVRVSPEIALGVDDFAVLAEQVLRDALSNFHIIALLKLPLNPGFFSGFLSSLFDRFFAFDSLALGFRELRRLT